MPLAITLRLDDAAADLVARLWQALADRIGVDDALRLGYRPHITLAVFPDSVPVAAIEPVVRRLAREWRALPVTLPALGVFPGEPPVLWVVPVPSQSLLQRHRDLHTVLETLPVHPHYLPGHWMPHVTLSKDARLPAEQLLAAALSAWDGPTEAILDRLDLVRFRPVVVLASESLAPGLAAGDLPSNRSDR